MSESAQTGLVQAVQVAREVEERRSSNGLRFATFGETGVPAPDLQSMIEAVPPVITAALKANTYFFVPLALREPAQDGVHALTKDGPQDSLQVGLATKSSPDQTMVASAYSVEFDDAAICHRNVSLGTGHQGVFISTRLMGDRFALCFEFFINVAHAFADEAGVPQAFADLVWQQATSGARGETSLDAWESRNLALGRPMHDEDTPPAYVPASRRGRTFATVMASANERAATQVDEKERGTFLAAAFSDSLAIYLLSLTVDFDYTELREREYPLLAPAPLAARLRTMAELFPPNAGYEFSVRYRRRA